jgi:protein SCO1/2
MRAATSLFVAALAALATLAAAAFAQSSPGHPKKPRGVSLAPLLQLVTPEGRKLDAAELRGRPFAVFFGFTSCPDVCPTTMVEMGQHLDALGKEAERLKVYFVTIDPERDTPEKLRAFLSSFDARITGLTGTPVEVATAAHAFGAYYEKVPGKGADYSLDHTLNVYLMDRYGLLAATIRTGGDAAEQRKIIGKLLAQ